MNPDHIARLSRKLLGSCLAEDGSVFLHSSDFREDIALLSNPLRDSVRELLEEIRSQIPTDFSFSLAFDFSGVQLGIEFEDGNTGTVSPGAYFTSFKSLRRHVKRQPWDELRKSGIEGGGIFDELLNAAEDRPVNIPSSEKAAQRYANQLSDAVTNVRTSQPVPEFALIIARDDLGLAVEPLKNREEVVYTIADRMTTQNDILAVLERGIAWPFPEIEEAKLEAVEQLGPISRAKAEGRFSF